MTTYHDRLQAGTYSSTTTEPEPDAEPEQKTDEPATKTDDKKTSSK